MKGETETLTLNFTEGDIESMLSDARQATEPSPVYSWSFETKEGTTIEVEISVGPDVDEDTENED